MNIKKTNKSEKITAIGSILSFAIAAALVKFSGVSVASLVNISDTVMKKMLVDSGGLNTFGSISLVAGYFIGVLAAFIFLTLAFAFLASYGFYENRKNTGLVLSAIGGVIFFFFLGFTIASLIAAVGIIISGYSIIPLANAYGQEFKKWIHFRVGSNSVSRAHFLFNLIIALAVFAAVLSNLAFYQTEFRTDLKSSVSGIIKPSLPPGTDQKTVDALIDRQVNAFLDSPFFSSYFAWLPVIAAFTVWAILEVLRLFLPFVAGAFTSVIIKAQN